MRDNKLTFGCGLRGAAIACASLIAGAVQAAAPGITGTGGNNAAFDLTAAAGYTTQPDGASIYTWGYGCNTAPNSSQFQPTAITTGFCTAGSMQLPGPTLIVHVGDTVTVTLHNNLPKAAGTTSILFPGFTMAPASDGTPGVLAQEAANGTTVTYSFVADTEGTHSYYSGTRGDVQVEMGLYGALIVLPTSIPTNCLGGASGTPNDQAKAARSQGDFRLAKAAFSIPQACYDREYLFQFSELSAAIHKQVEAQSLSVAGGTCANVGGCLNIQTEPYHPEYFLINGRSMPDDMDPNYASQYPHQPYNGNPHMHPGEQTLVRIIGQGRMEHPFHEHANHVRVLARDGNLLLTSPTDPSALKRLAGPLLFTTTTTPGMTLDGLFEFTGKGLNWDMYGHHKADANNGAVDPPCTPDANGYHNVPADDNYYEWCGDHDKALEAHPFGNVGSGGPITLPDPNILANGAWYGGSPYLGPDATGRAVGGTPIPPSGTVANDPGAEAGWAYMWHSHNEREITTNNIFPGGMMMMMLVDPWVYPINEAN